MSQTVGWTAAVARTSGCLRASSCSPNERGSLEARARAESAQPNFGVAAAITWEGAASYSGRRRAEVVRPVACPTGVSVEAAEVVRPVAGPTGIWGEAAEVVRPAAGPTGVGVEAAEVVRPAAVPTGRPPRCAIRRVLAQHGCRGARQRGAAHDSLATTIGLETPGVAGWAFAAAWLPWCGAPTQSYGARCTAGTGRARRIDAIVFATKSSIATAVPSAPQRRSSASSSRSPSTRTASARCSAAAWR